jgi:MFS family permease
MRTSRRSSAILLLLCVAQFMIALDFSIMNVALPAIQADLDMSDGALSWVLTAFALAFGGLLMLGGRAADLFGRRRMLVIGLWLFAASCLVAGLAESGAMLLASRAVQGAAGALVAPAALSLLTATFPEGPERTRALGVYGAVLSGGFVTGVLVGGLLTAAAGWRWLMLLNVPVTVAAALATPALLRETRSARMARTLDLPGAATVSLGVGTLIYAISSAAASALTLALLVASVALLTLFVVIERRAHAPLVPLDVLGRRAVLAPNLVGITSYAACGGATFALTLYMQSVLGYSPLQTGLAFCSLGLAAVVAGLRAESIAARLGTRATLIGGLCLQAVSTVALVGLPAAGPPVLLLVATAFVGFGHMLAVVAFTALATTGVTDEQQGIVGGLVSTSLQLGAALGVALYGSVTLASGFDLAFVAGTALLVAGIAVAAWATPAFAGSARRRTPLGEARRRRSTSRAAA